METTQNWTVIIAMTAIEQQYEDFLVVMQMIENGELDEALEYFERDVTNDCD